MAPDTAVPVCSNSTMLVSSCTTAPAAAARRIRRWSKMRRLIASPVLRKGRGRASAKRPLNRAPYGPTTVVPSTGHPPAASSSPNTPKRSSHRSVSGLMYSAQGLSRGNRARSMSTTRRPASASHVAVAEPAGPAPTTSTSTWRGARDMVDWGRPISEAARTRSRRARADRGRSWRARSRSRYSRARRHTSREPRIPALGSGSRELG